jgi:GNAT superfamily N-acetyltransferase
MISVNTLETLEELQECMPLFMEGFRAMNKRNKAFECDETGFVKTLVGILGSTPRNGIIVVYDDDEPIGYGAAFDDTPQYCEERCLLLWALYVRPEYSKRCSKVLFSAAEAHAKAQGYKRLKAYNGRLNGSSLNFFERVLGMRRLRMEFTKQLS